MAFKTALETSRGQDVQGPPRHPPLVLMAIILLGTMDEVWTCGWVEGGRRGGRKEFFPLMDRGSSVSICKIQASNFVQLEKHSVRSDSVSEMLKVISSSISSRQ